MKIYVVKRDNCTYDRGIYCGTTVVGYYTNETTAKKIAAAIKENVTTYRDGYVEEIEVNED